MEKWWAVDKQKNSDYIIGEDMDVPDINYLNQLGEFFMTYGPWAIIIFLGGYIYKKERDVRKERSETDEKRIKERDALIKRHEEYHAEVVELVKDSTNSKAVVAARLIVANNEIKVLRKALEQYLSLITEGIVEFEPALIDQDVEDLLKEIAGEKNIKFKKLIRNNDGE